MRGNGNGNDDGGGGGTATAALNVQRSKEQIRHFYYRTWHKIIKYVSIAMLKESLGGGSGGANDDDAGGNGNESSSFSLRDTQVKCLIAYNALMNKSQRK